MGQGGYLAHRAAEEAKKRRFRTRRFQLRAIRGYAVEDDFNDFVAADPRRHEVPAAIQLNHGAVGE
jgi:hypothetical protein